MKNKGILIFCFVLCILLCCGCTKSEQAKSFAEMEPVEIKFAHAIGKGELMNNIIEDWMSAVTERSEGKITFDYHPAGELGTFVEIIEQVDVGAVDMSSGEPSLFEPWCPEVSMLYAPLILDGYDHLGRCIYGKPGELIAKAMSEKNNTYILRWVFSGARVIASTRPLLTLADMKDFPIRSPESQVYIDTFTLLGMDPHPMAMTDMYQAIQQGVVQGCDNPAQAIYEGGYHQITGNICKTRHMYALGTLTANEKFWDGLPEIARSLMFEVWDELSPDFNASVQESEEGYYKLFEEEGSTVTEFEDRSAFKEIAQPYWSEKASSIGGNAEEILNAINELR